MSRSDDQLVTLATEIAIEQVKQRKPSQFTIGGALKDGKLVGGITYDRTWANGWGATAYAKAWWDDLPVSVGRKKLQGEAGVELTKKF